MASTRPPSTRPPKKSDTIEIRLSHEMKSHFMAQCQQAQRPASAVMRDLIAAHCASAATARPARRRTFAAWRLLAAGLAGGLLGIGFAVPSLAHDAASDRAGFDRLDTDHDGALSFSEYRAR